MLLACNSNFFDFQLLHDYVKFLRKIDSNFAYLKVPLEDLERASRLIVQALQIRKRYMKLSHQSFSTTASRFLDPHRQEKQYHDDKQTIEGKLKKKISLVDLIVLLSII